MNQFPHGDKCDCKGCCELYYDDNGKPEAVAQSSIAAKGETAEEVVEALQMMREADEKDKRDI